MLAAHAGSGAGKAVSFPAAGFTLIETMVTLAVLAILAGLATPAMQGMIVRNRLAGAANDVSSALHLARSEAIRRNASTRFCMAPATGDWVVETHPAATVLRSGQLHQAIGVADDGLDTTTVADHACVRYRPDGLPYDGAALIVRADDGSGGGLITLSLGDAARIVGISAGSIHVN